MNTWKNFNFSFIIKRYFPEKTLKTLKCYNQKVSGKYGRLNKVAKQKNRFKAVIENQECTIISKESPEHMKMVTELVNEQLEEIKRMSIETDNEQAAILLAINAVSDQFKKQEELMELKDENEALYKKAVQAAELENRMQRIEQVEQEAKKVLEKQGRKDTQINNHLQAQQILNENRKQDIQQKVSQG